MPSEFDCRENTNTNANRNPKRQNRSSSSGFSKAGQSQASVRQTLPVDGARSELPSHGASDEKQNRSSVDHSSQPNSAGTSSSPVKSWAAVLMTGKTAQRSASASASREDRNDQTKLLKSSSANHPAGLKSVVQSQTKKAKSRSATRDGDRTQFSSSGGASNRIKSSDRFSTKHFESQSTASIATALSRDGKTKSKLQMPQPNNHVAERLEGNNSTVKSKQGESAGSFHSADAASLQLKAAKQKKKKKKKLKAPNVAAVKTTNAVERMDIPRPAPEFDDLNEFPSLFSLKSESKKKNPLQTSDTLSSINASHSSAMYAEVSCDLTSARFIFDMQGCRRVNQVN